MYIADDVKLDYSDVMLVPRCNPEGPSSRQDVNLLVPYMGNYAEKVCPIITANMDGIGTLEMATELAKYRIVTALHKHYAVDDLIGFFTTVPNLVNTTIYSMGANKNDFDKFETFFTAVRKLNFACPVVCIDVANGYTEQAARFIEQVKEYRVKVIAGNVVTAEGVRHLWKAGADAIKIGIGSGSVCTTRKLTGIGYPQFSAVLEAVNEASLIGHDKSEHGRRPFIIADGGITCPGDIAKALAAGADYVMIGGMFAGHDEGGGTPCDENGATFSSDIYTELAYRHTTHRKFYGMASKTAQDKHNGGVLDYRASEGKEVIVPYRGPVKNTVQEILGGLRSSCAYQGVTNLEDIKHGAQFIRVNNQLNNVFGVL